MSSLKQKISQASLDKELAIHHEILDFTGNIIWVWELSTNKVTIYGDTHLRYGFSTDDALDSMEFWSSIVHKEDKSVLQKKYNSLFKGKVEQFTHTYRIVNSRNEILWERLKSRVYKYADNGKIASIISITNFYDTLESIENNSNEVIPIINKAFAGSGDSLWDWNLTNDTINISEEWKIGLGLTSDQTLFAAKSWMPNIHPDDLNAPLKAMLTLIKQETDYLNITYRIKLSGQFRWVSVRGNIIERSSTGFITRMVGIITDINTQKAQELLLQERDNQFSLSMLSTKSSLVEYDLTDGSYNHVGFKQENGHIISTATKITLDPLPPSIHPDDLPMVKQFTESLSNPSPLIKECTWRSTLGGGGYRWYKTLAHITAWDESGQAIKVTGIRQDITDAQNILVEREQILQREEIAYKDTYHSVYEWDVITGKIFFSPHFIAKITNNVSQWNNLIDDWKACVHPDDIGPVEKALEKSLSAEKPYVDITYRLRSNNDGWIWVNGKGKIETDADGTAIKSFGTVINITDLKKSEFALEAEKELAQTTLESINEAVITTDKKGKVLTLNIPLKNYFK